LPESAAEKRLLLEPAHSELSIRRQCDLLGLNRASYYYKPATETPLNLILMRLIDQEYTAHPFQGRRKMTLHLRGQGYLVNVKRVRRLMQIMGIEAIYPQPRTTRVNQEHRIYPYLLRGVKITRPNQVWSTDITYLPLANGFMYLTAVIDWYSRYVLAWQLSNTLDTQFCIDALDQALRLGQPAIFHSDQGSQFTSADFVARLQAAAIQISWSGRKRCYDNILVERLWRMLKYEEVYLRAYSDGWDAEISLARFLWRYSHGRPHSSLGGRTPHEVYTETEPCSTRPGLTMSGAKAVQ